MMSKKRNRLEIIHDILSILRKDPRIKRTHLMYKTNLTYVRLNNYLDELKGKELLSGDQDLFVTPKGEEFLQQVRRMKDFMEGFGL